MSSPSSDNEEDDHFSPMKTRRQRINPEEQKKKQIVTKKVKAKKRRRVQSDSEDEESDVKDEVKDSSSEHDSEDDFDTDTNEKKDEKSDKKKKKRNGTKKKTSSKRRKKKVKREKKTGRKKILKIISEDELDEETKAAEEQERQRLQRLKEKVESSQDMDDVMESTTEDDVVLQKDPFVKVAPHISKHLKVHQIEGVKFMWNNLIEETDRAKKDAVGNGCILAHCMGLGKTLQTITIVHTILNCKELDFKTVLVVCPLNTVRNWLAEIDMWTANHKNPIKAYSLSNARTAKERYNELKRWQERGGMMVMGYEMMRRLATGQNIRHKPWKIGFQEYLIDPGADMVVCDEGHMLKNANANISIEMRKIRTRRRIILTGTPLQNNLVEYHCMVEFVKPGLLGTLVEFRNRFMNPILNGQHVDSTKRDVFLMKKRAHVLHDMLKGFVQRHDYSILAPYLKPKLEYIVKCRLSTLQIKLYRHYLDTMTKYGCNENVLNAYGKGASLFADYQSLMRVWTHPKALFLHTDKVKAKAELCKNRAMINDESDEMEEQTSSSEEDEFGLTPMKKSNQSNRVSTEQTLDEEVVDNIAMEEEKMTNGDPDVSGSDNDEEDDEDELVGRSSARNSQRKQRISSESEEEEKQEEEEDSESEDDDDEDESDSESNSDDDDPASEKKPKLTRSQRLQRRRNQLNDDDDVSWQKMEINETPRQWYETVMPEDNKALEILEHSPKIVLLFEIMKRAEACGDKVLVFSQSLLSLDIIEEFLAMFCDLGPEDKSSFLSKHRPGKGQWFRNIDYFRMDGSIDAQRRQKWINDFNNTDDKRARLFLISTRAGSLGVNLVAANRVVIFDASWNPTHDTQSMFRVYRFGQTKPCYIYRLIAEGTMEEKIYQRQVTKQSLAFRVVDEQQINRYFTANSLAEMYAFKPTTLEDDGDKETPIVPKDYILADLLSENPTKDQIVSYHEHDSLLDHQQHEELTEEERKAAWDEFHQEKERKNLPPPRPAAPPVSRIFNVDLTSLPSTTIGELDFKINLTAKLITETYAEMQKMKTKIRTRTQITNELKKLMPNADMQQFHSTVESIYQAQLRRPMELQDEIRKLINTKVELMLQKHQHTLIHNTLNNPSLNNSLMQSILNMQHTAMVNNIDAPSTSQQPATQTQTKLEIVQFEPKILSEETKKLKQEKPTPVPQEKPAKAQKTIYELFNIKKTKEAKVSLMRCDDDDDVIEIESSQEIE